MRYMILILTCLVLSSPSTAACLGHEPMQAAKTFFTRHRDFSYDKPVHLKGIISKRLMKDLLTEYQCRQSEVCALDGDPWTDAQDGDLILPATVTLSHNTGKAAEVDLSYTFALSKTESKKISSKFLLEKSTANNCWLVSDLLMPDKSSLTALIEQYFQISQK